MTNANASAHFTARDPGESFSNTHWSYYGSYPVMIWNNFKRYVRLEEVTFESSIQDFQILGSIDENCNEKSYWAVLCQKFSLRSDKRLRFCQIPQSCNRLWDNGVRCLGLRFYGTEEKYGIMKVYNIRVWGTLMPTN